MIERNMLSLLMNIIRNNTTVEYKIRMRQLAMRNEKDHTFINRIQEVIQKYKLEPVEKLMEQPKSKEEWKRIVKLQQNIYWHERCKQTSLRKNHCSIYKYRIGLYQSHIIYGRVQKMTQSVSSLER